jgi:hypothetical protein
LHRIESGKSGVSLELANKIVAATAGMVTLADLIPSKPAE